MKRVSGFAVAAAMAVVAMPSLNTPMSAPGMSALLAAKPAAA